MTPLLAAIDPWILTFSAVTVFATLWMGFRSARSSKTASDFFVAGRSVSVGWNASAISGEYLSAASFMGVAGMVMSSGYDALWYPVCYACGYLFLLLFIAGPLRRFGAYTIPDFAEGRFDSPLFRKIAVVFVLFIGFFYTMPQMKGAGTTLAYIFPGLPYWVGVVLVGVVITLNVSLGGMKGITLVQAFQYWAKMFAISVPVFVLMAVYGHYGKQVGVNGDQRVPALKPGVEYRAAHTPATNQAPVAGWKQSVLASLPEKYVLGMSQTEANRLGLGQTTGTMLSTATLPLHGLLDLYGSATGKKVWIAGVSREEAVERRFAYPTNHVFGSTMLGIIREILATNGVALVSEDATEVRFASRDALRMTAKPAEGGLPPNGRALFLPTDEIAADRLASVELRKPLPDKAPPDDTWLNPFGPLTTKAAKAANAIPRWNLSAELRRRLVDYRNQPAPNLWGTMARSAGQIATDVSSRNSGQARASQFATFTNLATNATQSITGGMPMLSALREFGLLLERPVLVATNLPRPKLAISGSFQNSDPFVAYLKSLLLTNGVRLDVGGAAITAVAVEDWERYQKDPASVVLVPNRVFAMRVGPHEEPQPDGSTILRPVEPKILLVNYGEMLGKTVLMATNLSTNGVDFNPGFEVMLTHEAKARMERTLWERGITVIPAGAGEIWAVPTAELARYQLPPVNVRGLSLLYTYSLIIALVCGTAGLPHILVRFYTNPDGVAAKRTTMWVMILIGVFYVFPPVFGVMGRNLLPDLYSGVGAKGTDKVVLELPRILNGEQAGKRESENVGAGTNSALLPPAARPQPNRTKFPWGSILSGVTCAGAFAAFMSTFSGLLVSMTGALAHDVYGRMLRPKSTPEQRLCAFKVCAVLIGGVAIGLGCFVEPLEINFMVGQAFAIAAASYFPLLFMSVWWRGMTMRGAATGMLTGGLCALGAVTLTNVSNLALDKGPMGKIFAGFAPLNDFWAAHPLWRILCEQPAIWTVPLAILLMWLVSKCSAKTIPPDIRMKMLVLHAPEKLGLKQEYIQEHQAGH